MSHSKSGGPRGAPADSRSLCVLVMAAWLSMSGSVAAEPSTPKRVALIGVRSFGVAEQLLRRVRSAVLGTLRDQGAEVVDVADTHFFVAESCEEGFPQAAHLAQFRASHIVLIRVDAQGGGREDLIEVSVGSLSSADSPHWGPWSMTSKCAQCGDAEVVESAQLLTGRAWKAFGRARMAVSEISVSGRDRLDRGAALIRLATRDDTAAMDEIFALKKAVRAGGGVQAFPLLADEFFQSGMLEEAESYALKALAVGANAGGVLSAVYYRTGRWKDALEVLESRKGTSNAIDEFSGKDARLIAEIKRRLASPRDALGQAEEALAKGEADEARRLARMALGSGGLDWRPYLFMADAALKSAKACDAWAYFGKVLELAPTNVRAVAGRKAAEQTLQRQVERRMRESAR